MNSDLSNLVIIIPILLVSMAIHEVMHAVASLKLGDDTAYGQGRISWNPFVHIDPFFTIALPVLLYLFGAPIFAAAKPVEVNFHRLKWGEFGGAIVGAVGPLSNIVLAVFAALILNVVGLEAGETVIKTLYFSVAINVGLAVFNSIPWPPLDGSRVLYAFAPRPLQEFMEGIERMGIAGLILFMFLFYQFLGEPMARIVSQLTNGLIF